MNNLITKVEELKDKFRSHYAMEENAYGKACDDVINLLQNLQQTDCTALLELLEQMLKEENEALGKAGFYEQYKRETHANQKYCLAIVKQMIEVRQPVA